MDLACCSPCPLGERPSRAAREGRVCGEDLRFASLCREGVAGSAAPNGLAHTLLGDFNFNQQLRAPNAWASQWPVRYALDAGAPAGV
jgi:hypothetical protein